MTTNNGIAGFLGKIPLHTLDKNGTQVLIASGSMRFMTGGL